MVVFVVVIVLIFITEETPVTEETLITDANIVVADVTVDLGHAWSGRRQQR